MKEVKKCSISGVAFTMDADAYQELENYLDSLKKTYKDTPDGAGDRRRHRSPHSRADPHNAGQHPRGRETPDPEYHPPDGLGRGHLRGEFGHKSPRRAAYPAPPLPRHGERQAGRRMRRHRQVLRRRSRMDPAGHVPADPAELPALDSVHGLDGIDDGQPVRHLRHLLRSSCGSPYRRHARHARSSK